MSSPLSAYLNAVRAEYRTGLATEHSYRPALKALIEALQTGVAATNEPRRIDCGAPDYVVTRQSLTVGYVEAKDIGDPLDEAARSPQLKRYLRALSNLVLTDYLEFRWYVDGELRQAARLAIPQPDGALKAERGGAPAVEALLSAFLAHHPERVGSSRELAERMARLTHIIRDTIVQAFEDGRASPLLTDWRRAFATVLIADLDQPHKVAEFADMFAQTLAYGLFSARVSDPTPRTFTRQEAQYLIPKSNPFLRDFFNRITGPDLDDEPYSCYVDDLVGLLAHTDMAAVLADFGARTHQEDPVVHFYETFLAAYDPRLRESRGVYYTPEPVVSYIVRSVDWLLRERFGCADGLADTSMVSPPAHDPNATDEGDNRPRTAAPCHKVLILDPAAGTGTFLYEVIKHIRQQFIARDDAGMWPGYVRRHLLPRLFGFELLMAPYAVAHFKLGLQLAGGDLPSDLAEQYRYEFEANERLGVYLTNTLEEPREWPDLPLFTRRLADESSAANAVKRDKPVLVVLGNPPYSGHSANKGTWIDDLLKGRTPDSTDSYYEVDGQPLGERNPKWLQDDYVKFIRWGQWRIARTGAGILAFISNNGYLDNPTFRGMRQSLLRTFSEIYILDLHGNARKRETAPDGSVDENVFDIQQGVAIGLFVKRPGATGPARVYHGDLWGDRASKYERLSALDVRATERQVCPRKPFYLYVPSDAEAFERYRLGTSVRDMFPVNGVGMTTARDEFVIDHSPMRVVSRVRQLRDARGTDTELHLLSGIRRKKGWSITEAWAMLQEMDDAAIGELLVPVAYRPFDVRWIFYHDSLVWRTAKSVMRHMLKGNLALITARTNKSPTRDHFMCTRHVVETKCGESTVQSSTFPLYLYPSTDAVQQRSLLDTSPWPPDPAHGNRTPNLAPAFVAEMEAKLGLRFAPFGPESADTFGPEDVFHYIYAVLHSPTYRARYAEFLKIDFPRVPLASNVALFRALAGLGAELVGLHLLESPAVRALATRYPVAGDNQVARGHPRYVAPLGETPGRVYINATQYFEGVAPRVWEFMVGGYQVLDKWLKDRRGRQLSYDDLTHYQRIVVALGETIRLMAEVDAAIPEWPIA